MLRLLPLAAPYHIHVQRFGLVVLVLSGTEGRIRVGLLLTMGTWRSATLWVYSKERWDKRGMSDIIKMVFGSHLYGTDGPDSDRDYAGVFLPDRRNLLLGRMHKHRKLATGSDRSKNLPTDTDLDMYSLHRFIDLACAGETVAIDMLHAPAEFWLVEEDTKVEVWRQIVGVKHLFYTKNLKAFVGYARKQAAKYGIKGSRLDAAASAIKFFQNFSGAARLSDVWRVLPIGEHLKTLSIPNPTHGTVSHFYEICGRKIQNTVSIEEAIAIISNFYESYGARAKAAAENKGVDWKAVSHAMRAAFQLKEIYEEGTITFPLASAPYLKQVKSGALDYTTEVAPRLEELIELVENLAVLSDYPEHTDRKYWDDFIVGTLQQYVL